jgi:hypothetical protein
MSSPIGVDGLSPDQLKAMYHILTLLSKNQPLFYLVFTIIGFLILRELLKIIFDQVNKGKEESLRDRTLLALGANQEVLRETNKVLERFIGL